jgi:5-methylcytosine-specific restriction endonuclease McrA
MIGKYPKNWRRISADLRAEVGYLCTQCGCQCLPKGYNHLDISLRRSLTLQVHHLDGDPSNNAADNLIPLCAGCHLRVHRHWGRITPGQLSLPLQVPKFSRQRSSGHHQVDLTDLIDRLPRINSNMVEQLTLL